jgi:hypothetical protein
MPQAVRLTKPMLERAVLPSAVLAATFDMQRIQVTLGVPFVKMYPVFQKPHQFA